MKSNCIYQSVLRALLLLLLILGTGSVVRGTPLFLSYTDTTFITVDTFPSFDYNGMLDSVFDPIDVSLASTGILIDRRIPLFNIDQYQGLVTDSLSGNGIFSNALAYLRSASFVAMPAEFSQDSIDKYATGQLENRIYPILILDYGYNRMKTNAIDDSLVYLSGGKVYWDTTKAEPCEAKRVFVAAPYTSRFYSNPISFKINKENCVISDRQDSLLCLLINFGDGNGFVNVPFDSVQNITYCAPGIHQIQVKAIYSDDTLLSKSQINLVTTETIPTSNYSWNIAVSPRIIEGFNLISRGDAHVWYGCNNNSIKKPLLVVEGFDGGNKYNGQYVYELLYKEYSVTNLLDEEVPFPCELRRLGYDVIVLNFNNGGDYLQNNIEVVKECIRDIYEKSGYSSDIIVIGASTGGVLTRYALSEMEDDNEEHHCKLFAAYDSPLKGAFMPPGLQFMVRFLNSIAGNGWGLADPGSLPDVVRALNSPATSQQLIYYINESGHLEEPSPLRNDFLSEMNGLPYPSQSRNIALLNGSNTGTGQGFSAGDQLLHAVKTGPIGAEVDIWSIPSNVSSNDVMVKLKFWNSLALLSWIFGVGTIYAEATPHYRSGLLPLDCAPGGSTDAVRLAVEKEDEIGVSNGKFNSYNLFGIPGQCFVPTYSALDINESYLNSNILTSNPTTPFSAYYGMSSNSRHVFKSPGSAVLEDFLKNEIMAYDLFLQNRVLTETRYEAVRTITAGSNVVPASLQAPNVTGASWSVGPVVVPSGEDVTCIAGVTISLRDGFSAASGSNFHALIGPITYCETDCYETPAGQNSQQSPAHKDATDISSQTSDIKLAVNPNPANTFIRIQYELPVDIAEVADAVSLSLYDALGRNVRDIPIFGVSGNTGSLSCDLRSLPSGIYTLQLRVGNNVVSEKVNVVK